MLVLAIGDFHVPERATDIPAKFKKLLQPRGKIQQVLCVGNVTRSPTMLQFLKSLSPDFQMVKGDFDKDLTLPLSLVFTYDKLKVGLINGFGVVPKSDPLSLLAQARLMDVDVLIYSSTHKVEAYTLDGKFFVNPGSATGAFSTDEMDREDLEVIESILRGEDEEAPKEPEEPAQTEEPAESEESAKPEEQPSEPIEKTDDKKPADGEDIAEPKEDSKEEPKEESKEESSKADTVEVEADTADSIEDLPAIAKVSDEDLDTSEIDAFIDPIPSFCLLDLQGTSCTLYLYTYIDGEVKVDKLTYHKEDSA